MMKSEVCYKTKIKILELEIKKLRFENEELRKIIKTKNELLNVIEQVTQ